MNKCCDKCRTHEFGEYNNCYSRTCPCHSKGEKGGDNLSPPFPPTDPIDEVMSSFDENFPDAHLTIQYLYNDRYSLEIRVLKSFIRQAIKDAETRGKEDAMHFMDATIRVEEIRSQERSRLKVLVEGLVTYDAGFGEMIALDSVLALLDAKSPPLEE